MTLYDILTGALACVLLVFFLFLACLIPLFIVAFSAMAIGGKEPNFPRYGGDL